MKYVLSRIERKSCLYELERFMSDWVCLDNIKLFHIAAGDLSEFNDCVSQQTFINEVTLLVPLTKWLYDREAKLLCDKFLRVDQLN